MAFQYNAKKSVVVASAMYGRNWMNINTGKNINTGNNTGNNINTGKNAMKII